ESCRRDLTEDLAIIHPLPLAPADAPVSIWLFQTSGGRHGKRSDADHQGKEEAQGRQGQTQATLRLQTGTDARLFRQPLQRSDRKKILNNHRRPTVPAFDSAGSSLDCLAISRQVSNST